VSIGVVKATGVSELQKQQLARGSGRLMSSNRVPRCVADASSPTTLAIKGGPLRAASAQNEAGFLGDVDAGRASTSAFCETVEGGQVQPSLAAHSGSHVCIIDTPITFTIVSTPPHSLPSGMVPAALHNSVVPGCSIRGQPVAPVQTQRVATRAGFARHSRDVDLQESIGGGTFGDVYRCVWGGQELAVKIRRQPVKYSAMLDAELRVLKRLASCGRHISVVGLEAWRKKTDGTLMLFFQRCGPNLHRHIQACLQRNASVSLHEAVHIACNLCSALSFLHRHRIIHRDLKPGNVVLRPDPRPGHQIPIPAICDFGNSTIVARFPRTSARARLGRLQCACPHAASIANAAWSRNVTTLWYAAPEMLIPSLPYRFAVDMWALGLVLAEIEQERPICASSKKTHWEQLLLTWHLCQPVAAGMLNAFQKKAGVHLLWYTQSASLDEIHGRPLALSRFGSRFHAFVKRALQFDPALRPTAAVLQESAEDFIRSVSAA
jgi:serine/threonine protein kinase